MNLRITALSLLAALSAPAAAQTDDAYAPARAIVADVGKIVTPNGVQETFEATLGGARQVVNVRGSDKANPILVFVHGGPGAVEMPFAWAFNARGKTCSPSSSMTSAAPGVPIR